MSPARRGWQIVRVVLKYRLLRLLPKPPAESISAPWRWLLRPFFGGSSTAQPAAGGTQLRLALEELGPVFIKFGQMLSTRRDLLPPAFAEELRSLQDDVPPFPGDDAKALVMTGLGAALAARISHFDTRALASASIAQVHTATLHEPNQPNPIEVVVKVKRPNIQHAIHADIALMYSLARTLADWVPDLERLHPVELVAEYEQTILEELDFPHEAQNTVQLRHNFADSATLYVPRIYPEYCRDEIIVMERIYGVPISNMTELKRLGVDFEVLAQRGVETFFTQVFAHNFFHADMHPGNIFINASDPASPSYIAIDCAIIGSLTERDQDYLAKNLLAFFNQDYARVAQLHLDSGWVPADTDAVAFEAVIREVCEPVFAKPLSEISFGEFLLDLFNTARQFNMEMQPQLALLQKTLLYIEGLGRELYPDLDLWETGKPFIEQWMRDRMSPNTALRDLFENAPQLAEDLPNLPAQLVATPGRLNRMENRLKEQKAQLDRMARAQAKGTTTLGRISGVALVVLGSTLFVQLDGALLPGMITTALGIVLLLRRR